MRHTFFKLSLLCTLLCGIALTGWSQPVVRREKADTVRFTRVKSGTLKLDMKFGNIDINLWDKNEIMLISEVQVTTYSEAEAEKQLKERTITQGQTGDLYSIRMSQAFTHIEAGKPLKTPTQWTVFIPRNKLSLDIFCQLGNITITEPYECRLVKAEVQYGKLSLNEIKTKEESHLAVDGGTLEVAKATRLNVKSESSTANIGEVEQLRITCDRCINQESISLQNIGQLDLDANESHVHIETVTQGTLRVKESRMKVGRATGDIAMKSAKNSEIWFNSIATKLDVLDSEQGHFNVNVDNAKTFTGLRMNGIRSYLELRIPQHMETRYQLQNSSGKITMNVSGNHGPKFTGKQEAYAAPSHKGYIGNTPNTKRLIEVRGEGNRIIITE